MQMQMDAGFYRGRSMEDIKFHINWQILAKLCPDLRRFCCL
jgi:hypothetical protein